MTRKSQIIIRYLWLLSLSFSACGNKGVAQGSAQGSVQSSTQDSASTPNELNRRRASLPDPKKAELPPEQGGSAVSDSEKQLSNAEKPAPPKNPVLEKNGEPSPSAARTDKKLGPKNKTPAHKSGQSKVDHKKKSRPSAAESAPASVSSSVYASASASVPEAAPEAGPVVLSSLSAPGSGKVAGQGPGDEEEDDTPEVNLPENDLKTLTEASEKAELVCKNGDSECPLAVVLITVPIPTGIAHCTGFLISENEVMTNDHCVRDSLSITKDMRKLRKDIPCSGFIHTHFIASSPRGTAYTVGCESIEMRSGGKTVASSDYAIIKLQSQVVDRTPLKLSTRGFKNGEGATIYRVQPDQGSQSVNKLGQLEKLNCKASYGSYRFPAINAPNLPIMTFGNCPIQLGNSGSPALNEDGEVGAIIHGFLMTSATDTQVLNELESVCLDSSYGTMAISTQIMCMINVPGFQAGDCGSLPEFLSPYPKRYVEIYGSPFEQHAPELGPGLAWRELKLSEALSALHKVFVTAPLCTNQNTFESRVMKFKEGLNRSYLPEWRVNSDEQVIFKEGNTPHRFYSAGLGSLTIPACAD